MVRLKNRYLLVHILYPDASQAPNARAPTSKPTSLIPEVVQFRQPTPDTLTPQLLTRAIRDEVSLLFGDYGVGATASSLSVSLYGDVDSNNPLLTGTLSPRMGRAVLFDQIAKGVQKAEEEAIRRARATILKAQKDAAEGAGNGLDVMLGPPGGPQENSKASRPLEDVMVDIEDDDDDDNEEDDSPDEG